jgi:hypothetical protein
VRRTDGEGGGWPRNPHGTSRLVRVFLHPPTPRRPRHSRACDAIGAISAPTKSRGEPNFLGQWAVAKVCPVGEHIVKEVVALHDDRQPAAGASAAIDEWLTHHGPSSLADEATANPEGDTALMLGATGFTLDNGQCQPDDSGGIGVLDLQRDLTGKAGQVRHRQGRSVDTDNKAWVVEEFRRQDLAHTVRMGQVPPDNDAKARTVASAIALRDQARDERMLATGRANIEDRDQAVTPRGDLVGAPETEQTMTPLAISPVRASSTSPSGRELGITALVLLPVVA